MTVIPNQKSKPPSLAATATLLVLLLAGCGSRNAADTAIAPPGPRGPWFCEPAMESSGWDCTDNPDRIANPRPSQPLARALAAREAAAESEAGSPVPGETRSVGASADADDDRAKQTNRGASEPAYARLAYLPEQPVSLLDLPPDFYAVQVAALDSAAELESLFDRLGVNELTAAEVEVDGDLRYVLLLGIYETFAAAEQAAADPPAALASYYPWVRRLQGLQAEMRRADQRRQRAPAES